MPKYTVRITATVELSEPIGKAEHLPDFDISYSQSAVGGDLHWANIIGVELSPNKRDKLADDKDDYEKVGGDWGYRQG